MTNNNICLADNTDLNGIGCLGSRCLLRENFRTAGDRTDRSDRTDPRHAQPMDLLNDYIRNIPCYHPEENSPRRWSERLNYLEEVTSENEREFFIHSNSFPGINPGREEDAVRIKHFGCNSIYITDGRTRLLIDPFFTRPRANMDRGRNWRREIRACPRLIEASLDYAGIRSADAILMTHAHWDHALDIAEVWHALNRSGSEGPMIYGCGSIRNIALGGGVPPRYIVSPVVNKIYELGNFKICFLPGAHGPMPVLWSQMVSTGRIRSLLPDEPFGTARVRRYKQGEMADILIEHPHGLILNKGSANFVPGVLRRLMMMCSRRNRADSTRSRYPFIDVLIMSCSGFNTLRSLLRFLLSTAFLGRPVAAQFIYHLFWNEVIRPTKPRLILLSHWERFTEGRENWLDRRPSWMYRSYQCKGYFDRRERENFRYKTRFIPFWEDITILPIHERDSEGNISREREPSAFQLPDATEIPDLIQRR